MKNHSNPLFVLNHIFVAIHAPFPLALPQTLPPTSSSSSSSSSSSPTPSPPLAAGDAYPPHATASVSRAGGLWCEVGGWLGVGHEMADVFVSGEQGMMRVSVWVEGVGQGEQEARSEEFRVVFG